MQIDADRCQALADLVVQFVSKATAFVFLFVSEHQPLFGFQDYGYRTEIVVALAAEAVAVVTLAVCLATRVARRG